MLKNLSTLLQPVPLGGALSLQLTAEEAVPLELQWVCGGDRGGMKETFRIWKREEKKRQSKESSPLQPQQWEDERRLQHGEQEHKQALGMDVFPFTFVFAKRFSSLKNKPLK